MFDLCCVPFNWQRYTFGPSDSLSGLLQKHVFRLGTFDILNFFDVIMHVTAGIHALILCRMVDRSRTSSVPFPS